MAKTSIENWWQAIDENRAQAICRMWADHGAGIAEPEARQRAQEVVCAVLDETGSLIGVSTAVPRRIPFLGETMFYFRAFLIPNARGGLLIRQLMTASWVCLNAGYQRDPSPGQPIGIFLEIENPQLSRDRERAVWQRPAESVLPGSGLVYVGRTPRGLDRRIWYFEKARLARPGLIPAS